MAKKSGHGLAAGLTLVAGAAAAVAGAYYFYGKDGAKHRKDLKSWGVKARGEIMEKLEGMEDVSKDKYHEVVTQVLAKYKKMKNVAPSELADLTKELKGHWDAINKALKSAKK